MKLTLFSSLSPAFGPAPELASEQVLFSPWLESVTLGDRVVLRRVPRGHFNLADRVSDLNLWQTPDAVAVLIDEHCASWPRELARITCPKVLLVAGQYRSAAGRRGLADYVAAESFDLIVGLDDRASALALRALGAAKVAWLPGWHFPHRDAEVAIGRKAQPENRVAFCADGRADDRVLLAAAKAVALRGATVYARMSSCRERPVAFGSSAVALVDGRPGDLRLLEALAVGVPSVCLRPPPEAGADALYPDHVVQAFAEPEEAAEHARFFLSHPGRAHALGEQGARWFDEHFSARDRQGAFAALVLDNRIAPNFALPSEGAVVAAAPAEEPLPEDAAGRRARELLEAGELSQAVSVAAATIKQDGRSWPSCLVMAEMAMEGGQADLWRQMLAHARALNPRSEHLARLELGSRGLMVEWRAMAGLARAWEACGLRDWKAAVGWTARVLKAYPQCAEAGLVGSYAALQWVRQEKAWAEYGKSLAALQNLAESADRADVWHDVAVALRQAGGVMQHAVPAYRAALQLDPERAADWFGLGEVLLRLGRCDEAAEALAESLRLSPDCLPAANWLGHARKRQGRLAEAEICHARGFGSDLRARRGRPAPAGSRRRAVFVLQNGHGWPSFASVIEEFRADPGWETLVVGLPWRHPSFEQSTFKDADQVFDFLQARQIPHVRWNDFALVEQAADIVFLPNPYDSTRPPGWTVPDLVAAGHRICYVPYGIELGGDEECCGYQFDMKLHRYAWAIFARSAAHRTLFARHCLGGDRHVAVTGHPKFDDLGRGAVAPDPAIPAFAAGRTVVLWNPHFDAWIDGTRHGRGFSTFPRWADFLLAEFARRTDLAFVLRPHPNFFATMEQRGIMSRAELDQFVERCSKAGVLLHTSPAYFAMLSAVDALITDCSSLLVEFGITGRPMCYLHNPDGPMSHREYELDFDFVRQNCAWALEEGDIRSFLDGLPAALADADTRAARAADLRRRMGVDGERAGRRIKREIERRLSLEAAPASGSRAATVR